MKIELWYAQYSYDGRWYEISFAVEAGMTSMKVYQMVTSRLDSPEHLFVWRRGHISDIVMVQTPQRISATSARDREAAIRQAQQVLGVEATAHA